MKCLVTGSRDWKDIMASRRGLEREGCTIVIVGGARGADALAAHAAHTLGIKDVRTYPAQWNKFGRAAGSLRNQQMLDEEDLLPNEPIDVVLAFPLPDSIGTWDMIRRVERRNATRPEGIPKIRLVVFDKDHSNG